MTTEDREKFIELQIDVRNIKEDVRDTNETVKEFNKDFQKLTFHLFGDADTNREGLIEDFSKVKIRLSRVEKFYIVVAGILGVAFAWLGRKLNL